MLLSVRGTWHVENAIRLNFLKGRQPHNPSLTDGRGSNPYVLPR